MARNPPQTLLIWFRFVIPAQSHKERVGLFTGFKKMIQDLSTDGFWFSYCSGGCWKNENIR